jgi:hypothetical protein
MPIELTESQEQTQEQVENTAEQQTPEEQAQSTTEVAQEQENPDEQFLIKAVVDGQEQIFDVRDVEQRKALQENAQKGIHYTKKMQSLTEFEKANQAQINFSQRVISNPDTLEILVAQENGLNPASLYGNPTPPPETLAQTDPILYSQQLFAYQSMMWERQKIKDLAKARGQQEASINNSALFEKARIESDLNDTEYNQVKMYMQNNFRPNLYGMFSKEQMDAAIMFVTGKARATQDKLNTIQKIDKALKTAAQPMNTSVRPRSLPKEQEDRAKFHEFVRETTRS